MQAAGYAYIPLVGSLLCDFSQFMNQPSLVEKGERQFSAAYFANFFQFVCYILSGLFYIRGNKISFYVFISVIVIFAISDACQDAKDVLPPND